MGDINQQEELAERTQWGDCSKSRAPQTLRIGLLNHGGFPVDHKNPKTQKLRNYIINNQFDIACLTESNLNWKLLPIDSRLDERTYGWWETLHKSTAYFKSSKETEHLQVGGVTQWSINKAAHRVIETGSDSRGLGRWTWVRYRGKATRTMRVITAYRPVKNKDGAQSVWNQQKTFLDNNDIAKDPLEMFQLDLLADLAKWKSKGDQIILAMDVNDNVYKSKFSTALHEIGLEDVCTKKHGQNAPKTYEGGQWPIDAIYATATLQDCKCGYLEFEFDHRGLFIDIPMVKVFGTTVPPTERMSGRRLKCNDPRIVRKYNVELQKELDTYRLCELADSLHSSIDGPLSLQQASTYERIDKRSIIARARAEKRCRKYRTGQKAWSVEYQKLRIQIEYWQLRVRLLQGKNISHNHLKRKAKAANANVDDDLNLDDARKRLATAYRRRKREDKKTESLRETWLEGLASAKAEESNTTAEKQIDQLKKREQQRKAARIIKRVNGKLHSGSITSIIGPDGNGGRKEYFQKAEMEETALNELEARFNQASGTPFMQPPLYEHVGPLGTGPSTQAILDGDFQTPPGTDPYAAKLIPHLSMPQSVKDKGPMSLERTLEEYRTGWKKARESTASGNSSMTFSHFMAGASDPKIAQFELHMSSIPYTTGYSPLRWQQGLDVLLEKKAGNFNVEKLRAILLYEPDFNQNNKKMGRDMMYYAEDLSLIALEQYGSRKGHEALLHCLNKRLTFDLCRQSRMAAAMCSNDAKSCYDRIVHSVASLCMQRVGVPKEPIICMFTTIQKLKHHIRTVYGDSTICFTGRLWVLPVQGVGQGNGAGPPIWAVVSTPVLNMLRAEGHGIFFKTCLSGDTISFVGYAFVDDTDLIASARHLTASGREVTELLQKSLDDWEGGIRATGGAIVPEKSHWYLIDFKWQQATWKYVTEEDTPAELFVLNSSGERQKLERLEPSEARRTLGIRLAPDGNQTAQLKHMKEQSNLWAERIRTGHLPRHLAWQSLLTTILRTLNYPLMATTLTRKQCDEIVSPIMQQGLAASGIVRTLPLALRYGPLKYRGLALPNLWSVQFLIHIVKILKFSSDKSSITGKLMHASLEALKLEIGIDHPLLANSYATYGCLATDCWISRTWQFLSENGMTIEDNLPPLKLQRENDLHIVQAFSDRNFSSSDLRTLNQCRVYLQATTLSDIVTGDGVRIRRAALVGIREPHPSPDYVWPNQGRPGETAWKLWKESLRITFGFTLRRQLGHWLSPQPLWKWWFSPSDERLYELDNGQYSAYPRNTGRPSRQAKFRYAISNSLPARPPPDIQPATIERQRATLALTGHAPVATPDPTERRTTVIEACRDLPEDARWAVANLHITDNGVTIAKALREGTCIAVSDGSFKDEFGTACWIVEGLDSANHIYGQIITPGYPADQSAYRSETAGIYGIATIIKVICQVHQITEGSIEFACDGETALNHCGEQDHDVRPQSSHCDLVEATRKTMATNPGIVWTPRHVKGHQDDFHGPWDRWAHLNIFCDTGAKDHFATWTSQRPDPQVDIANEPWSLWIDEEKVSSNLSSKVLDHIHGTEARTYWKTKHDIPLDIQDLIDHQATHSAMKASRGTRRHWVTKHSSGFCATGKVMVQRKQQKSAKCPMCPADPETAPHVWTCPGTKDTWNKSLKRLETWMHEQDTAPTIIAALLTGLKAWHSDTPLPTNSSSFPGITETVARQNRLGWRQLLEGFPVIGWAEAQSVYYTWLGSRRTGKRWLTLVIQKLWDIAWDLWDHRNDVVHNKDTGTDIIRLHQDIKLQLDLGSRSLPKDTKRIFRQARQTDFLARKTSYKTAWLARITAARGRHARKQALRSTTTRLNTERNALARHIHGPNHQAGVRLLPINKATTAPAGQATSSATRPAFNDERIRLANWLHSGNQNTATTQPSEPPPARRRIQRRKAKLSFTPEKKGLAQWLKRPPTDPS